MKLEIDGTLFNRINVNKRLLTLMQLFDCSAFKYITQMETDLTSFQMIAFTCYIYSVNLFKLVSKYKENGSKWRELE